MSLKHMTFLFFFASCTTLSHLQKDPVKLIDSVRLTGEGKGRLTLGSSQYLFGVDSVLKDNFDWILAVSIPLHGEEVMILPNLKDKVATNEETGSFEERIRMEFKRLKLSNELSSKKFLEELRALVRFNLSSSWGQKRDCKAQQSETVCEFDGEKYVLTTSKAEFSITKFLDQEKSLVLSGKNLTESFFKQTDIRLYTNHAEREKKQSSFSLELFW